MRSIAIGVVLSLSLIIGGRAAFAGASCDSIITKAKGKLVSCECGLVAKGQSDFSKCVDKFNKSCDKGNSVGGCVVQVKSCAANLAEGEQFRANHCQGSPSGAFLE